MIYDRTIYQETISMIAVKCCACGITFGMPSNLNDKFQETNESFYCPSGHKQSYVANKYVDLTKSYEQKLLNEKKQVDRFIGERNEALSEVRSLKKKLNDIEKESKKKKKLEVKHVAQDSVPDPPKEEKLPEGKVKDKRGRPKDRSDEISRLEAKIRKLTDAKEYFKKSLGSASTSSLEKFYTDKVASIEQEIVDNKKELEQLTK